MKPLAVFYHTRLSGGDPPIDFDHAFGIMEEQMGALKRSGLEDAADSIYIGVNGGEFDFIAAGELAPKKAVLIRHPDHFRGELPTLNYLQKWLPGHEDWYVLYHHCKGAIHKGEGAYHAWRRRMQSATVDNWQRAVEAMDNGSESVGAHWLTPEQWPSLVGSPFWGGNFWWAKASFLLTLPTIPETATTRAEFYIAESWIGSGPHRPIVTDYHPGWP